MPAPEKLTPRKGFKVSERLCALINDAHDGNIRQAAAAYGVDYDALWRAATGRSRGGNLDMLKTVAEKTGTTIEALIS